MRAGVAAETGDVVGATALDVDGARVGDAAGGVVPGMNAGRAVRVAAAVVGLGAALGAVVDRAIPTTTTAHPTTAAQDTADEIARLIDM